MVIEPDSDKPDYPLKRWDVVLKIGDHEIDSNGLSKVRDDLRLSYQYFVPKLAREGCVRLSVWRDRKLIDVDLPVRDHKDYVMPPLLDKYPRYFIFGPMVFTQVTQDLARPIAAYSGGYTSHYRSPLAPRLLQTARVSGRGDRCADRLAETQDFQRLFAACGVGRSESGRHESPQLGALGRVAARCQGRVCHGRVCRPN